MRVLQLEEKYYGQDKIKWMLCEVQKRMSDG
jgi:hypothetical protein